MRATRPGATGAASERCALSTDRSRSRRTTTSRGSGWCTVSKTTCARRASSATPRRASPGLRPDRSLELLQEDPCPGWHLGGRAGRLPLGGVAGMAVELGPAELPFGPFPRPGRHGVRDRRRAVGGLRRPLLAVVGRPAVRVLACRVELRLGTPPV